jgi:hypothetical protein
MWRNLLPLGLVAGVLVAPSVAQDRSPAAAERPARDEAFRMVDAYVVSNLQESLGLSDAQFAKAIPLVKRLQAERREYLLERTRAVREMRRLLRQGGATEAEVVSLLNRVKALDGEGPARTARNLEALDAMLSPLQQAKYRVLEAEVEQRLREVMGRNRPRAAPRQGGPAPRE